MTRQMGRRIAAISVAVALGACALALSGIGAQVAGSITTMGRLGPATLGAASICTAIAVMASGMVWWRLLQSLGHRMPYRAALTAYLSAGLAGYVVNFAGPALGSTVSLRRHGVGPGRAVLVTLIANVLGFLGILAWAPLGLLLLSGTGMDTALPILGHYGPAVVDSAVAALVVGMLVALRVLAAGAWSGRRLARLLRISAGNGDRGTCPAPRYVQLLVIVPYSALSWVMGALALYVVLAAMSPGASPPLGTVVGAAVVAAALGSLAIFAPEGMGVKDGALVALLTHATGLPISTCVAGALAMRALDPLTKLGLLGVLATTAYPARAFRRASAMSGLRPWKTFPLNLRARMALMSAGVLMLWLAPSGAGALAHAGREVFADHDVNSAVVVPAALAGRQTASLNAGVWTERGAVYSA